LSEVDSGLLPLLTDFIAELRTAGVPASMVEAMDAMAAIRHIDLADRTVFKTALAATLVKNARHYEAFNTAFEVFFAAHREPGAAPSNTIERFQQSGSQPDIADLKRLLLKALTDQNPDLLQLAIRRAIDELAGMEPGRPVGGTYYLYRTLRRLDLEELEQRLWVLSVGAEATALEERLARDDVAARIEALKEEIKAEIRRRLVADRGKPALAKTLRKPLLEDIDLMHATRADLDGLEAAVEPLTRKLAARLAQKRRKPRGGRLDFRRTMRRSLSSGGVPLEPVFRAVRPHKPEIALLCDVSGSMATFARFTLQFTYAMASQFARMRSFVFIDSVDEVTDVFHPGVDFVEALERVSNQAAVVWLDGHSDYGHTFEQFWAGWGRELSPRTTLIVAGDARNNYREPRADVLGEMAATVRALIWLNPEPRSYWDTGDSVIGRYARHCDSVYEVRNLRQLEAFVGQVALPRRGRITQLKAGSVRY